MGKKKAERKDAKRIRGLLHENDMSAGTSHVQDEMGNTSFTTSRPCSACDKEDIAITPNGQT